MESFIYINKYNSIFQIFGRINDLLIIQDDTGRIWMAELTANDVIME